MARVHRNINSFEAAVIAGVGRAVSDQQRQLRRTRLRALRALENAATRHGGTLSRVGRATGYGTRVGSRLGVEDRNIGRSVVAFRATGAWQLVDNSTSDGPTKGHFIKPRNDKNPRPLPPATTVRPTMETRSGGFVRQPVWHPGSARRPYWRRAVQSVQPTIVAEHGRTFAESVRNI